MTLTLSDPALRPCRITVWPAEAGRYGIDFVFDGEAGYAEAERAERRLGAAALATSFRHERDGEWTIRVAPLPRERMRAVLDRFAW